MSVIYSWGFPALSDIKAISREFGDQVGEVSIPHEYVKRRIILPEGSRRYISELPEIVNDTAIYLPSGETAAA